MSESRRAEHFDEVRPKPGAARGPTACRSAFGSLVQAGQEGALGELGGVEGRYSLREYCLRLAGGFQYQGERLPAGYEY